MTPETPKLHASKPQPRRPMVAGISLANKCQLLFGVAVLAILAAALSVPWALTSSLVHEGQFEAARQLADAWLAGQLDELPAAEAPAGEEPAQRPALRATLRPVDEIDVEAETDPFVSRALRSFREDPERTEVTDVTTVAGELVYRYARVLPAADVDAAAAFAGRDAMQAILFIDRTSKTAEGKLLRNHIFLITVGLVAGLLAIAVFYLILTKLILSPVRRLRETTENVQAGDLAIRSQIQTGDEFQQLAEGFNAMLAQFEQGQSQLRAVNENLDLKVSELSEANIGLFESNRLKSEFLASVSHELRTPLNSIIGFAEVLNELASSDGNADPKRLRYINNILTSGRSLLEMINELLEMAKIEAGRMEVNVEPTSISDLIEGLSAIMRPQAEAKRIELKAHVARNLPMVETDPGKLQQILYNFISNAIKFTPPGGTVTTSADRLSRQDRSPGVRLAVSDTGPGIPYDLQDAIFEKFRQVDASHTRQHAGTGLGLAICRELADLLGATVSLVSEPGRGATFYADVPLTHQPEQPRPLMA